MEGDFRTARRPLRPTPLVTLAALTLVALLALAALPPGAPVSPSGEGSPALVAPDGLPGVRVPAARVGDRAVYVAPGNGDVPRAVLEWLPPVERQVDHWSRAVRADVLRTLLPRVHGPPSWDDFRDAFGGDAGAHGILWREGPKDWAVTRVDQLLPLLAARTLATDDNVLYHDFAPQPFIETCLAHHGLQGSSVRPGDAIPLATLCPAAAHHGVWSASAIATAATFAGRPAVELTYRGESRAADAPHGGVGAALPRDSATLRFVLADGWPFMAALDLAVTGPSGTGGYQVDRALSRFDRRSGEPIPAWREDDAPRPPPFGARFTTLMPEGPKDGGSWLPYTLEAALDSIRSDPTLKAFHEWEAAHPVSFVARADFRALEGGAADGARTMVQWNVTLADWDEDSQMTVVSTLTEVPTNPLPGTLPGGLPGIVVNQEETPGPLVAVPPRMLAAVDVASTVSAWSRHAPTPFWDRLPEGLTYLAPRLDGRPPLLGMTSVNASGRDGAPASAQVWLNLTSGALAAVVEPGTPAPPIPHDAMDFGGGHVVPHGAIGPLPGQAWFPALSGEFLAGFALGGAGALLGHRGDLALLAARLRLRPLLHHPKRGRLYRTVQARPGEHLPSIAKAAGLTLRAATYHARVLERGGFIVHVDEPEGRRWFAFEPT